VDKNELLLQVCVQLNVWWSILECSPLGFGLNIQSQGLECSVKILIFNKP
jgi:hypothetical protein